MSASRSRLARSTCRVLGHKWAWILEDDWPQHECTRCGSCWGLGRPLPRDFDDLKALVLARSRDEHLGARDVWMEAHKRYPEMSARHLLWLAERVVGELCAERHIRLLRGREGQGQEWQSVEDAEQTLREWSTWADAKDAIWLEVPDSA